ncbi:MAG: 50S ribosomal protein L29 [Ignavibacteriales bacterium]|nr:50S ribosomal protein L29 [Ignavibacteriales bacterium]
MKINEIRELSTKEIQERIDEERRSLVDLRFTHSLKQLTNTSKLKDTKKTIARLLTELANREKDEQKEATVTEASNVEKADA